MTKLINLINLDEIKTLRVTCEKCHAFWSIPVPLGENKLLKKCNYCETEIPNGHLNYIEELLDQIKNIQKYLKNFNISIELEIEKDKSYAI